MHKNLIIIKFYPSMKEHDMYYNNMHTVDLVPEAIQVKTNDSSLE